MALEQWANNAASTLASGITNVATSLTVAGGEGALFPTLAGSQFFYATLVEGSTMEIVLVTARAADVFTITRAQQGTSGSVFSAGVAIQQRLTKATLEAMIAADGSVPMTANLDLGGNDLDDLGELNFDPALAAPAHAEGKVFYDQTNKCLAVHNDEADVVLQVGQEQWVRVRNESGATILNGKAVRISGESGGLPLVVLARADTAAGSDVVGFATHDIENNSNGYVTEGGIVRDVDTSAYAAGDNLFLSSTVAGEVTGTPPSLPNFEVHLGHAVVIHASTGTIFTRNAGREADYVDLVATMDGMAFDKADIFVVDATGLQFEMELTGGGGDVSFLIDGVRSTLDCTTGAGVGGRARVALTEGADANTPQANYLYVTDSGGVATLVASTTLPTGAFAWVGRVCVTDAITWGLIGELTIQRYTEKFSNDSRGALSHQREKLRAIGAVYISGGGQTLTIATAPSPDSVHLEVASAAVYQLHRQTFPALATGPYYYGNGLDIYEQITDLNAAFALQDGTAITNNDRYNLVIWGAVNYSTGSCKLFVNLSTAVYGNDSQAIADTSNSADFSVPADMRSVAFMICRVVLKYTTAGGGTFVAVGDGAYSLLGTLPGVRSGGSGASTSTEFSESTFRVLQTADPALEWDIDLTALTASRGVVMPDADVNLGNIISSTDQTKLDGLADPSVPAVSVATAYTLDSDDKGDTLRFSSSSAITLTLNSGAAGDWCIVYPVGTGVITVANGTATARYSSSEFTNTSFAQDQPLTFFWLTATDVAVNGLADA